MKAQQVEENGQVNSTPVGWHSRSGREWWSNLIADRKKLILVGSALGLVIIFVIFVLTLILAASSQDRGTCALQTNQPSLGPPRAVIAISEWGETGMAKLGAFIHVKNAGYLSLDFEKLAYESVDRTMTFVDKCVNVSVILRGPEKDIYTIRDLRWMFSHTSQAKTDHIEPYEYCTSVTPPLVGKFPPFKRYSCLEPQSFKCLKPGPDDKPQPVASLIIESFEFQLRGDPAKYRRGEFSNPAYEHSCQTN